MAGGQAAAAVPANTDPQAACRRLLGRHRRHFNVHPGLRGRLETKKQGPRGRVQRCRRPSSHPHAHAVLRGGVPGPAGRAARRRRRSGRRRRPPASSTGVAGGGQPSAILIRALPPPVRGQGRPHLSGAVDWGGCVAGEDAARARQGKAAAAVASAAAWGSGWGGGAAGGGAAEHPRVAAAGARVRGCGVPGTGGGHAAAGRRAVQRALGRAAGPLGQRAA